MNDQELHEKNRQRIAELEAELDNQRVMERIHTALNKMPHSTDFARRSFGDLTLYDIADNVEELVHRFASAVKLNKELFAQLKEIQDEMRAAGRLFARISEQ